MLVDVEKTASSAIPEQAVVDASTDVDDVMKMFDEWVTPTEESTRSVFFVIDITYFQSWCQKTKDPSTELIPPEN